MNFTNTTTAPASRSAECGLCATDRGPRTAEQGPRTPKVIGRSPFVISPAFSLIEILVTVALLSFIILGLFAVFNQTQRAFRSSMTQTDVLEAGRAANDLLARDLEQLTPSGAVLPIPPGRLAMYGISVTTTGANFYAQMIKDAPVVQSLPGGSQFRTNFLEDVFILTRDSQNWIGTGYCVRTQDVSGRLWLPEIQPGQLGVGSLYRYTATLPVTYNNPFNISDAQNGLRVDPANLCSNFLWACQPGSVLISNRVCDGVIHFHLRSFATNGFPIISENGLFRIPIFRPDAFTFPMTLSRYSAVRQATVIPNSAYPDAISGCWFWSNSVPAAVELEFGILEPRSYARYNSIPVPAARLAYLQRDDVTTRVALFRQRVAIRNVDPLAFQ